MKKVLFVINTLGGAGAERALLELLKRFTPDQYEVDLYILLEQGELISQVPEYVNILNRNYTAESVLSAEGKKKLNKKVFMRLFTHLDSTYDMKALDLWKSISWDGFDNLKIWKGYSLYEYIGEHLGYRLVVRTVELKPIRRGRAEFMFEIENTGFGRVFQETELFLIMKNRNETREVPISMDMRKIQAGTRICGKTVIKLMEGRVSLKLQRKKDGRIIHFANKNSTDTLYLGSLHCGKIYLSEE